MKRGLFILVYIILMVAQIIVNNYFGLSRYLLISVLPALILLLPRNMSTILAMLVAFATGFAVDFFSTGMLGLTSVALMPVALGRRLLVSSVFGDEPADRDEQITIARFGLPKVVLALLLCCATFFLVFVWVDSAGTVPFWTAALRWLLSVLVSTPVGLLVSRILRPA